jgi:HEAT repeat protein
LRVRSVLLGWVLLAPLWAQDSPTKDRVLRDLDSRNYQTQRRAVLAARKVRDPKILEKLLQLAVAARHPNIRGYACESLGHYRDPRIFPLLKKAATSGPVSTKMGALPGLGLLGDPRAFDVLVKALENRSDWGYAATGLRHLGDKRGAAPLADVFRRHRQDYAVFGAVAEAILALDADLGENLFFWAICDPKTYRQHRLDRLLGQLRQPSVRQSARKLLKNKDIKVQKTGLRILGGCGDAGTVAVLLKVMDGEENLRLEAIRALGDLGHELAVPQVARYLVGKSDKQRAVAAEALGKIGHGTAVRSLVQALQKETEILPKLWMIEALGRIGDKRAVSELGRHLKDDTVFQQPMDISSIWGFPYNVPVSWTAWWAITSIRKGKPEKPLRKLLQFHGHGTELKKSDIATATSWWQDHRDKPGYSCRK